MSDGAGKYNRLMDSAIENVVRSFFDDYERDNAEFRAQSGLPVEVIREEVGDCCDWCADLADTYDYWDAPEEVWQRHANCRCMVIARTEKGTWQDAWSRKEYQSEREARIAREKEILEDNREGSRDTKILKENKMLKDKSKRRRPDFFVGSNGKALPSEFESWIGDNKMSEYLSKAQDQLTKNYIRADYRKSSFIGDGGTADIRRFELATGRNCGRNGNDHSQKVEDLKKQIKKILLKGVSPDDTIFLKERLKALEEVSKS